MKRKCVNHLVPAAVLLHHMGMLRKELNGERHKVVEVERVRLDHRVLVVSRHHLDLGAALEVGRRGHVGAMLLEATEHTLCAHDKLLGVDRLGVDPRGRIKFGELMGWRALACVGVRWRVLAGGWWVGRSERFALPNPPPP